MPQLLKVPTLEGEVTKTVTAEGVPLAVTVPEEGLALHQVPAPVLAADQFKAAVPVLLTVKVWPAGVEPPEIPVKFREDGESTI